VSESSPADLAVAFRSFPRRLGEALASLAPDVRARAASHASAVTQDLAAAAAVLGLPGSGEPAAIAGALADKIDSTRPDAWDDATLGALRRHALAIGASLRLITDLAG
jgi:hypothetical protein